jgi:crossover junction endodeoxyribonuclease RuvC
MLGRLPLSHTAIPESNQDAPCVPSPDAIAAARDLIGASSAALTGGLNSLGVDLGLDGGIATLSPSAEPLAIADMPTLRDGTNNRRSVNAALLSEIIAQTGATHAYVEWVSARPTDGSVQAFSFGRSRGVLEGICAALNVRITFLTPPVWKRCIGLPPGKENAKDLSRSAAIARWPSKADWFARVKDNGRSDACLIALAGLMKNGGVK